VCLALQKWLNRLRYRLAGFPLLWESPGIVFIKFRGSGNSWKISLVLEILLQGTGKSWNLLGHDSDGLHSVVGADVKISCSNLYIWNIMCKYKKLSNSFFAVSSQHVTVINIFYSTDATIVLHTHTHTQPFNGLLSGTTRVGRYQKKHSPTHTRPDHRTSFIIFLHLQRSMASSLFSLRA